MTGAASLILTLALENHSSLVAPLCLEAGDLSPIAFLHASNRNTCRRHRLIVDRETSSLAAATFTDSPLTR